MAIKNENKLLVTIYNQSQLQDTTHIPQFGGDKKESNMNNSDRYAQDRIENELDGWYSNLDFYLTAFGGNPDSRNVEICNSKIAELQSALEELEA